LSEFDRALPTYRLAETVYGDDLQAVAGRELGDPNRWAELVWINSLSPPYITDDASLASARVLLSGALIKVPSPVGVWTNEAERGQVYERDCEVVSRQLSVDDGGDLSVLRGADNLRQQLQHRLDTPRGQARRHPDYGNLTFRLIGAINGPTAAALGAAYVKSTLMADYRVKTVEYSKASVSGDVIRIEARIVAIEGGVIDLING
jgi:phage baseplate assembly protein W